MKGWNLMNPMTFTKAWVAGVSAPIANWLIGMLAGLTASWSAPMPEAVQVALVGIVVAAVVYLAPANRG